MANSSDELLDAHGTAAHKSAVARREIICPRCGGANPPDAVFCANPKCQKALGEFKYVREQLRQTAHWHETMAEKVVTFIGKPHFLGIHLLWFAFWIAVNSGILAMAMRFDTFPFSLLGIILAMETIFITGFVLISQNRQAAHADKCAELDYEVNVLTYRKINDVEALLLSLSERLEKIEAAMELEGPRQLGPLRESNSP